MASDPVFRPLVQRIMSAMPVLTARQIANVIWALANLLYTEDRTAIEVVLDRCLDALHKMKPQEVTNTLWAAATLGAHHRPDFFYAAARELQSRDLHEFAPQGLSNVLWAYATVNIRIPELFDTVRTRGGEYTRCLGLCWD